MKKILSVLSTITITASPLLTVVACAKDDSIVIVEKNGSTLTFNVNVSPSDLEGGLWKNLPTIESKYAIAIATEFTANEDSIRSADTINISFSASGHGSQTINADVLSQYLSAPDNLVIGKIAEIIQALNLSVDGQNPGGEGAEIPASRYDFEFGPNNPDSTNRPTTIADLKALVPDYYDSLSNTATGDALFKELQTIQAKYRDNVGSYAQLWEHYKESFTDKWDENDGSIWDMYGEVPSASHGEDPNGTSADDVRPFTPGTSQDSGSGGGSEGNAYNREHLIPQSYFNSSASSSSGIKNDPHFTVPADKRINTQRSNWSFGEVSSESDVYEQNEWAESHSGQEVNGGVRGPSALTGTTVFEPVDWVKGDVARSSMYFLVTWTNSSSFDGNAVDNFETFKTKADMSFPYFSTQDYADLYREWNMNDPVDQYNVDVNNSLAQSNEGHLGKELVLRNPFTDMPELAELIWA